MITAILWDVDGTLLDFCAAEKAAIQKLFEEFGLGECSEEMLGRYSRINRTYWERLERGEITKPEVLVGRFKEFFETEGMSGAIAPQFNKKYQLCLGDTIVYRDESRNTGSSRPSSLAWKSRMWNFLTGYLHRQVQLAGIRS